MGTVKFPVGWHGVGRDEYHEALKRHFFPVICLTNGTPRESDVPPNTATSTSSAIGTWCSTPSESTRVQLRGDSVVTFVVDRVPVSAGIDPYHVFIDRQRRDNVVAVRQGVGGRLVGDR